MSQSLKKLAADLGQALSAKEWKLVTAESCTGGGVAYFLTETPGSSQWFERGFVTYSNLSKEEMLSVRPATITEYGAVSEQTAREMAEGALAHSQAQTSIAITGIAGPDGGTPDKPVGTVWFAWSCINQKTRSECHFLQGTRHEIRQQAIQIALEKLRSSLTN